MKYLKSSAYRIVNRIKEDDSSIYQGLTLRDFSINHIRVDGLLIVIIKYY